MPSKAVSASVFNMVRAFCRLWLCALLIVALAAGQVPMSAHAMAKPTHAAASVGQMDGHAPAPCDMCDRTLGLDGGGICDQLCSSAGPALPVAFQVRIKIGHAFAPITWPTLPDGRTIPPEPDPPRAFV
ncbi:MAG: hypothetical protein AB7I59_02565 [Geminicoccaceae bacterium]